MDEDVEFVSEPIEPEAGSFGTQDMSRGLAALPGAFTWRGRRYEIVECLSREKESQAEGHTEDGERYLRREAFEVRLDTGQLARIYVLRQAPRGAGPAARKRRWYMYTIAAPRER